MQNVCLFAHFDKDDRVDEYVLRYLKKIKQLQFSIIFISTAKLPKLEVERLRLDCDDIILRQNTGFDFGSWSDGFSRHADKIGGRLLLANDSVYGPIGSLASAFDRLTAKSADFYGFVESIESTPHLQSWFLLFEPWVVRHFAFNAILHQSFSAMSKNDIIKKGELSLSRRLRAAGFKYNALYLTGRSGLAARYLPANPTQFLWRELLLQEQIPFLKVELLRDNPFGLEDAKTILSVVESVDCSLSELIRAHLARSIAKNPRSLLSRMVNRSVSKLARRGYHLNRAERRVPELWNFMKLALLSVALRVWNCIKLILLSAVPEAGRMLRSTTSLTIFRGSSRRMMRRDDVSGAIAPPTSAPSPPCVTASNADSVDTG
jgi:lipopolysaccharide biosynthesis protein